MGVQRYVNFVLAGLLFDTLGRDMTELYLFEHIFAASKNMRGDFLFRFLIISTIILLVEWYVYSSVRFLTQGWTDRSRTTIKYIYWGWTALVFTFFLLINLGVFDFRNTWTRYFMGAALLLFVCKLVWALFLFMDDAVRLFKWGARQTGVVHTPTAGETGISRLKFFNYLGFGAAGFMLSNFIYGIAKGAHKYTVHEHKLKIKNLPSEFENLKIVQISDIHSGSFWDKEAVERGVEMVNAQNADIVFFTGDLVNDLAEEIVPYLDIFGSIDAPLGVYSILGNHDYADYVPWSDFNKEEAEKQKALHGFYRTPKQEANLQRLIGHHKSMGWELLMDEHKMVDIKGKKLAVVGIQNWSAKRNFPRYGNLAKAYAGAETADLKLLLSHDPSHWREEVTKNPKYKEIAAMFAGHTHGMQFGIDSRFYRWSPVKFVYKEFMDLYTEGDQHLYVNRGFGYLGFPGRVGVWPEISVFQLTKA